MLNKIFVTLLLFFGPTSCARILAYFPTPSVSHQIAFQPIWKELALRGHQVTVISPNILGENITNLIEIDVGHSYGIVNKLNLTKNYNINMNIFSIIHDYFTVLQDVVQEQFESPEVMKIIKSEELQYDLLLVEAQVTLSYAMAAKYRVPTIGICSFAATLNAQDAVGNPTHPIATPEVFLNTPSQANFINRLKSFAFNTYFRYIYYSKYLPMHNRFVRRYFGNDVPYLGDLERNISLLLINANPLTHIPRPNVPAIIEISQMHIKEKQLLPNDLKQYLDNSKEGAVYFSLGSNIRSVDLEAETFQAIFEALADLPYKVLWKWEADHLPNQPKNIKTVKWLPQQAVLSHPNIKVFVTQGGIQSIEEAIINGVPMVGIPFFADQPSNVLRLVSMGVAKGLDFATLTKEALKNAIVEVATDKTYKKKVLEMQTLLHDVPMKGLDKAIWWIEYVLRHKGAKHLVSPTRDMPCWKYYFLDIFVFVIICIFGVIYVVYKLVRKVSNSESKNKFKVS